jgi:hypothetical protein
MVSFVKSPINRYLISHQTSVGGRLSLVLSNQRRPKRQEKRRYPDLEICRGEKASSAWRLGFASSESGDDAVGLAKMRVERDAQATIERSAERVSARARIQSCSSGIQRPVPAQRVRDEAHLRITITTRSAKSGCAPCSTPFRHRAEAAAPAPSLQRQRIARRPLTSLRACKAFQTGWLARWAPSNRAAAQPPA